MRRAACCIELSHHVVRLALLCLTLGALPVSGQVAAIAVYTQFQNLPSQSSFASLKTEVASIMAPLGLELEWRSIDSVHGNEVSRELAVVTFKGTCDPGEVPSQRFRAGALGWTHLSNGVIIPFMDVDCDRIRGFVWNAMAGISTTDRERVFGRAAGRVVAHELYHILGRSTHHRSGPVDRPAYSVQELLGDDFGMDEAECRILQLADSRAVAASGAAFGEAVGSAKKGAAKFIEKRCSTCHGAGGEGTRHGPALRSNGQPISDIVLTAMLGIDSRAMCHRADQLKIPPPSLKAEDIPDLLRFLNSSLY